jgi:uncharacterized protein (TIGR03085 family)
MPSTNYARIERAALADLFAEIGPDRPTLCEGWRTRDLAAHIVVRDRRPDAAAGVVIKALAPHNDRVRIKAMERPWDVLIDQVRRPPRLSIAGIGPLDRLTNTSEFFVHHEDARRAESDWSPRPIDPGLAAALARQIGFSAKLALRRFPARITIDMPGYAPIMVGGGAEPVTIAGDPGEMTLFLTGRQAHARITATGDTATVTRLTTAHLGV